MKRIHLEEVGSTNTWMLDYLSKGQDLADETVVFTLRQTAGRGQVGNGWESEFDKNVAFSMLLKPEFLPIPKQFAISQVCCLGVVEALSELAAEQGKVLPLSIKWPNDIYAGDSKLAGILIENRLMGMKFAQSVLGVGINVNQEKWIGNAPNPISLKLLGIEATPEKVLEKVIESISKLYHLLKEQDGGEEIHSRFMQRLYRRDGFYPYYDPQTEEHFDAEIVGVEPQGPILLKLPSGEERRYWFKEVRFVLPCGVTKE